jgi:uncharacterized protein YoxC
MSLDKHLARIKQINKNVQLQESSYARRYRFYDIDQDASKPYGLDEDDPTPSDVPAEPGNVDEPFQAQGGDVAQGQDFSADGSEDQLPSGTPDGFGGTVDTGEPGPADMGTDALDAEMGDVDGDGAADPNMAPDTVDKDVEVDVTELVNGTQEVNQKVDGVIAKLDMSTQNIQQIMQTVSGLEGTIQGMQSAINGLTHQIELMRPATEAERRKVVQQNSYPFNQSAEQALSGMKQTQTDLEKTSQKLSMQGILSNYNEKDIKDSF